MKYQISGDGVDHINIYSQAQTELGRFLSNMRVDYVDFIGTGLECIGEFTCLEQLWHILKLGNFPSIELIPLIVNGKRPTSYKKISNDIKTRLEHKYDVINVMGDPTSAFVFKTAMRLKLESCPVMAHALVNNQLPLAHYYHHGPMSTRITIPRGDGAEWKYWDVIRSELIEDIEYERLRKDNPEQGSTVAGEYSLKEVTSFLLPA